ncbi:hypothetical protein D3C86_1574370 [compost metagenome]
MRTTDGREGTASGFTAGTNTGQQLGVIGIDIGVVGQDIAARTHPRRAVEGAAGFDRDGTVVGGNRVIVGTVNSDGQCRGAGSTGEVTDLISEGFCQGLDIGA